MLFRSFTDAEIADMRNWLCFACNCCMHKKFFTDFYLTAKTDRFLVVSKEQQMTPQGGLGSIRGENPGGCRAALGNRRYYGEHSTGSTFLASEPPGTMGNTALGALSDAPEPPGTMGNTALGALSDS